MVDRSPTASIDILIVDDEPHIRETLQETLTRAGYSVAVAGNGLEALERARQTAPRLVICDLIMPEMDGVEAIAALRAEEASVAIIAISGGSRRGGGPTLDAALAAGADTILEKPFGAREVLAQVARYLTCTT